MIIKKILNNNAVIALDNKDEEIVVTGLGLAFKMKAGQIIDDKKVERIFRMENDLVMKHLKDLISELPSIYFEVAEEIITYANQKLKGPLSDSIYLTLTDHLAFTVRRNENGMDLKNPMHWEIKRYYQQEYIIGQYALMIIEEKLKVNLPKDEAASIAMHLVNAEGSNDMPKSMKVIEVLQDALNIIKYHFNISLPEESLHYERLVTHLKFFAQRLMNKELEIKEDDSLFHMVKEQYREAYQCARKIKDYAKNAFGHKMNDSELTYLIVHIQRVVEEAMKDTSENNGGNNND